MFATAQKANAKPSNSSLFQGDKGSDAFIQPKLNIGKPGDAYEMEADRVADTVVERGNKQTTDSPFFIPSPSIHRQPEEEQSQGKEAIGEYLQKKGLLENRIQEKPVTLTAPPIQKQEREVQEKEDDDVRLKEEEQIQKQSDAGANPEDSSSLESNLNSSKGGGSPLPISTKNQMESSFGTDFSGVRVHNDSNAVSMSQNLGAQAFTHGNDIYFNKGKYNPSSTEGKHLLAHELTHTVQQGASVQRKPMSIATAPKMVQGFGILDVIPNWIINRARHIPGYTLFTVLIEYDPLLGQAVERTPINLTEGLMGLVPFGTAIFDKLQEYDIIQRAFDWISGQLNSLHLTSQGLLDLVEEAWEEVSFPYTNIISVITNKFQQLIGRIRMFASSLVDQILTWIKEALIGVAEPILAENRAWTLIKKIIHYDPLRDEEVNAPTVEILEDFLLLIGKETELEQMREKGTLQETADWLDTQVGTFTSLLSELRGLITALWHAIQPSNLVNIADNLITLAAQVGAFLQGVWDFASGVALKVLELVKGSLLGWLSDQASGVRGYSLITVVIGKDPFTQETVPRTVPNLIRGFMGLMDGGEEQYAQMVETGAIARIVGQIDAAVETLDMTPQSIVQLFTDIWDSITIDDLIHPIDAFVRIIEKFGAPIGRLIVFVAEIVRIVIIAILEIMNFPFDLIGNIITRALEAIEDIKRDPIGFLKNILRALKQGFIQFFDNIVTHLINGVTGWLMRELRDAGVPELTDFSLQGVISWVLEVLGITMERIWEKLAAHPRIGPERVARIRGAINTLEGIWTFIKDIQERGMAAIWEKIQEQLSNLWNTVLDAVTNFVMERIVAQVTVKLLGMLDPTGIMAVINGAMAFFNAIQSFIQYLREMLEVVNSFVNGVADIARGNVATAANYLENTMGQSMPVVVGFLANQVGLSGIGSRIAEIIGAVREMVDNALTWLVNKAVDTGMALLDRVMGRSESSSEEEIEERNSGQFTGVDEEFDTESGESHTLYLRVSNNGSYEIIIESTPTVFEDFIIQNFNRIESPTNEMILKKDNALATAREVDRIITSTTSDEEITEEDRTQVDQKLDDLARVAIAFMDASTIRDIPEENIVWGSKIGSFGSSMSISYLKSKTTGQESSNLPFEDNQILMQRKNTGGQKYYRNGHLLNANLHGPDDWKNLTPLSSSGNSRHLHQIESRLKDALPSEGNAEFKAFRYVVIVDYSRGINTSLITQVENSEDEYVEANRDTILEIIRAERYVPTSLRAESVELENVNGNWVDKSSSNYNISTTVPNSIGNRPEDYRVTNERVLSYPVSYSTASREDFLNAGFSERTVDAILLVRGDVFGEEEVDSAEKLHPKILENISGSGGRVTLNTIRRKINF